MKLPRNPFLRKLFILPFLALAGLLVAEVYQRMTVKTPEEVLNALGAQQVMSQTMRVNGRDVLADVWRLPEYASSAAVRKTTAKVITVGQIVYVFHDDFESARGQCDYPADLPYLAMTCDYVVDAGHSRFVSGASVQSADLVLQAFAQSAEASGWTPLSRHHWQKDKQILFIHARDEKTRTIVAIALQKDVE